MKKSPLIHVKCGGVVKKLGKKKAKVYFCSKCQEAIITTF